MCVTGGTTDCEECPHSLLCNEESVCQRNLFKNPDVLEMINRAKVCVESERESMDYCMRNAGPDLANMIKNVEDNGDTIDCCKDNKYFAMVCEGPKTTTTAAPPAPAPAPAPAEESPPAEEEPEPEKEEEEPGTTTTTTTTEDLMARIERMAKEYGLVPEDEEGGDDAEDGAEGGDGSDGGSDGDGGGDGDAEDADSAAAAGGAGGAPDGAAGSMAMDKSAKATADQVRDQNDMRLAANEEEVPPRKMG